jgi:NADH-quinone oxidoreductase subunit M
LEVLLKWRQIVAIIDSNLLTFIIFVPLVGMTLLFLVDSKHKEAIRLIALATMIIDLVLTIYLFFNFNSDTHFMQFVERKEWIKQFHIYYQVGVDGISLLLVMLTGLLGPIIILSSWASIQERVKEYHIFMLLLQTAMMGTLLATDLFLFYVFWEIMLIPMYFLIGVWGGPRRIYAAVKFFLFTMTGSVLMLVAIIYIYLKVGTFDLVWIMAELGKEPFVRDIQILLFAAFAIAFAIKVPMFPFHTWLPDAHVEAPTAASVILAGVLLKMGTYGFFRFAMPLFPEGTYAAIPIIAVLALIGIIYGALVSMVQDDVKKLVAFSSVSHLGFVMLGLFALNLQAAQGALIQMINHGLSTGALFLMVGIIYERRHTRMIADFGGLSKAIPLFAAFFMIVCLSSIGLPGLNGFVGEFLILLGTYNSSIPHAKLYAIIAATGVIFAAIYMLWMYQRVMFGPLDKEENKKIKDLNLREIVYLSAVLVFIVWIGVYPKTFLSKTEVTVKYYLSIIESRHVEHPVEVEVETEVEVEMEEHGDSEESGG